MASRGGRPIEAPLPKPRATLYRLIEAGQLAHRALVAPLRDRGLEPGDDAVLFLLGATNGLTVERLADGMGVEPAALNARIVRLSGRDLVCRREVGADAAPGLALTERGERVRIALEQAWSALDSLLLGNLDAKERRRLNRALKHVLTLLR